MPWVEPSTTRFASYAILPWQDIFRKIAELLAANGYKAPQFPEDSPQEALKLLDSLREEDWTYEQYKRAKLFGTTRLPTQPLLAAKQAILFAQNAENPLLWLHPFTQALPTLAEEQGLDPKRAKKIQAFLADGQITEAAKAVPTFPRPPHSIEFSERSASWEKIRSEMRANLWPAHVLWLCRVVLYEHLWSRSLPLGIEDRDSRRNEFFTADVLSAARARDVFALAKELKLSTADYAAELRAFNKKWEGCYSSHAIQPGKPWQYDAVKQILEEIQPLGLILRLK